MRFSSSSAPALRRIAWYVRQIGSSVDPRLFLAVLPVVLAMAVAGAAIVTVIEKPLTLESFGASVNWALQAVVGRAPAGYVVTAAGWLVYWILIIFGVTLVGAITGALVAVVVNALLKEGQGLGVSGFRGHVVVCGWNNTARELVHELRREDPKAKIAVISSDDRSPAGKAVYYVKGDPSEAADLERAGIKEAAAAAVFPLDSGSDADMKSVLVALTVRSIAPWVRVVAEVNDPGHVDHFRRAGAAELVVTRHIASRLLARSALYPGVSALISDLVSSGGSELYTVGVPTDCIGLPWEQAADRLRLEHRATLVAIRRSGAAMFTAPKEFTLQPGDEAVVIAEQLGRLVPYASAEQAARSAALSKTVPGIAAGSPGGSAETPSPQVEI